MSKKDKEVPSKEELKEKIAQNEIEEALTEQEKHAEEAAADQETLKKDWTPKEIAELVRMAKEGEAQKERLMRVQAEYENHKKRLVREKEDYYKFATESLLESILPVLDNFDLALQHAETDTDPKHLVQGIVMIRKMLEDTLSKQGLVPIQPIGKKFDPHKHEAIGFEENEEKEEGTIVEVIQKGYLLHDRLFRPATVKITKKKSK